MHSARFGGYVLPVDLGIWGLDKDQGRCSLELARTEGWVGRPTSRLSVRFATYNPALRFLGTADISFVVDPGEPPRDYNPAVCREPPLLMAPPHGCSYRVL